MKKFLSYISAVAIFALGCFSFAACGSGDGNDASELDGKYYSYLYQAGDDDSAERGYIELNNGKCKISGDSPAGDTVDFTVNGKYIEVAADETSSDFRYGTGGIINNGVIMMVFDGVYIAYCKRGKSPTDIFKNVSGVCGKFIFTGNHDDDYDKTTDSVEYAYRYSIVAVGNVWLTNTAICNAQTEGDTVTLKEVFVDRHGVITNGKTYSCEIAEGGNAVCMRGERFDWLSQQTVPFADDYCKLGYGPDGARIKENEHIVTFDLTGGGNNGLAPPLQIVTKDGKLNIGMPAPDEEYYPIDSDNYKYYDIGGKPSKSGYVFTGFNTERDGSGEVFSEGMIITEDSVMYAQWREREPGEEYV